MKTFLPLILLLLLSVLDVESQNAELSGSIKQLDEVDQGPFTEQCNQDLSCTLGTIRNHVVENFDKFILNSMETDSISFNLKFIVDTKGKIVWARAQGSTEDVRKEGKRAIKTFPAMEPAAHEGEIVNVIGDLPIILKIVKPFKEAYDPISEAYDTPPHFPSCKGKESLKECSSKAIQEFLHQRMNTFNLAHGDHSAEVIFEIDSIGKVRNISATGSSKKFKKKAIKVIKRFPDFVPATMDGKKITVTYRLPIFVQIRRGSKYDPLKNRTALSPTKNPR